MKRVRTFILWIITNGHFITISFPRKILQGGFVYFTPMRAGHYRVYSQLRPVSGVVGSGMENHARYGEMIYGHKDNNLYVNLSFRLPCAGEIPKLSNRRLFPMRRGVLCYFSEKERKNFPFFPYSRMDEAGSIMLVC